MTDLLRFDGEIPGDSFCRVEVISLRFGGFAAIVQDVEAVEGSRVADAWDGVVRAVLQAYRINPRATTWIARALKPVADRAAYQLVTFKRPRLGEQYGQVDRRDMTVSDWRELGLEPR